MDAGEAVRFPRLVHPVEDSVEAPLVHFLDFVRDKVEHLDALLRRRHELVGLHPLNDELAVRLRDDFSDPALALFCGEACGEPHNFGVLTLESGLEHGSQFRMVVLTVELLAAVNLPGRRGRRQGDVIHARPVELGRWFPSPGPLARLAVRPFQFRGFRRCVCGRLAQQLGEKSKHRLEVR